MYNIYHMLFYGYILGTWYQKKKTNKTQYKMLEYGLQCNVIDKPLKNQTQCTYEYKLCMYMLDTPITN